MIYINDTTEFYSEVPSVVTLGKFDGFHRGHQKLLREVKKLQEEQGLRGIVFTISSEKLPVLLSTDEKRWMVEQYGIDCMIRCPFVPEILSMDPETFVSEILIKKLQANYIVVGTDFRFGHQRTGDVRLLGALQQEYGFTLRVMEKECLGEREISSTYVKEALAGADMELVTELLGYPYLVKGTVQHGRKLGRKLGMPTVNLIPEDKKLLPPPGVYFSRTVCEGRTYFGMTNVGYKPTVDGSFLGAETYLFGTNQDMYEKELEVSLMKFRRQERKFDSVEELKAQMQKDIQAGKEYFRV